MGHRGLLKWWQDSWSSSRVSSGDRFLMRCNGNAGIPFPMKQGYGPSSQYVEGKPGLFLSCGGTLSVPFEWRRLFRGICRGASRVSRTLSRLKREGGTSLETPQRKRASSHIEGRISCFFSSYGSKLGVPLELRRGPQGPTRGGLRNIQSPCELRGASQDPFVFAARAEVLIWS